MNHKFCLLAAIVWPVWLGWYGWPEEVVPFIIASITGGGALGLLGAFVDDWLDGGSDA